MLYTKFCSISATVKSGHVFDMVFSLIGKFPMEMKSIEMVWIYFIILGISEKMNGVFLSV